MQADRNLVRLGHRRQPPRHVHGRRGRHHRGAERARHLEAAIELRVGEARVHVVAVGVDGDARGVELFPRVAEVIERGLEPPLAQILARLDRFRRGRSAPGAPSALGELRLDLG